MKSGKVWGETVCVFNINGVEAHALNVSAGAYCSKHRHTHRFNGFFVSRGCLEVWVWKDYGLTDCTILMPGDSCAVAPGEYHRFIARAPTQALEWYWAKSDPSDIERVDRGGSNAGVLQAASEKIPIAGNRDYDGITRDILAAPSI